MLNFDVNDFDEGYCGPFTWDVKRLVASLFLICHSKGFSDNEIRDVLRAYVSAYLKKVYEFYKKSNDHFSLTLRNTTGKVKKLLNEARIKCHVAHLDEMTVIENYDRRFKRSKTNKDVDDQTRAEILKVNDIRFFNDFIAKKYLGFSRVCQINSRSETKP